MSTVNVLLTSQEGVVLRSQGPGRAGDSSLCLDVCSSINCPSI